jgi:hypothetical protein
MAFLGYGNGDMYLGTSAAPFQMGLFRFGPTQYIFAGTSSGLAYAGMPWCKTIYIMPFPFFDSSMGTPWSGQLFPTGTSAGASGQVFPTRG